METSQIAGLQKTTALDYPGEIASIVFFSGCNLCCGFCHNSSLLNPLMDGSGMPEEELLAFLEKRAGFIDGVVISGGEPTLQPDLPILIEKIRVLGLKIKLDTNGLRPDVLESLLERGLIDYVALDMKTSPGRYPELGGGADSADLLKKSIEVLLKSEIEFEVRTTCVPGLVGPVDIAEIGIAIEGVENWYLQQFNPENSGQMTNVSAYSSDELHQLIGEAQKYGPTITMRGIDLLPKDESCPSM